MDSNNSRAHFLMSIYSQTRESELLFRSVINIQWARRCWDDFRETGSFVLAFPFSIVSDLSRLLNGWLNSLLNGLDDSKPNMVPLEFKHETLSIEASQFFHQTAAKFNCICAFDSVDWTTTETKRNRFRTGSSLFAHEFSIDNWLSF